MKIKQSVINTFNRVGIDYESAEQMQETYGNISVRNRFTGVEVITSHLVKKCIEWVYRTNDAYDLGVRNVNISDFDRVRYFVLEADPNAYMEYLD